MTSNSGVFTTHLVIDVKTGFSYGIILDASGKCTAAQVLNTLIERQDGIVVKRLSPLVPQPGGMMSAGGVLMPAADVPMPYGQTTQAIEWAQNGKKNEIFTLVWPTKEEFESGIKPLVARKEMPDDLVKAGIAASPLAMKGQKGSGVDNEEDLKEALKTIDSMIGLDRAKDDIKRNIAVAQFNRMKVEMGLVTKPISRHMVFTGNPGTGKTTFAREVAKVYHALGFIEKPVVHEVKREDLVGGYVGQTALKTKEQIEKAKGGILFIDEAYALSRGAGGPDDGKDFGREAIDTLVAAMENMREELIVIVAGYTGPMKRFIDANEGLKSRFMTFIDFEDYSMKQLGEIMDSMVKERGYVMAPDAREHAMKLMDSEKNRAQNAFGNGRTVRNLVEKTEKELALRLQSENKLIKNHGLSDDDLKSALTRITLADVKAVSLDGLSAVVETKQVTFGGATPPVTPVANDSKPPARAVPAAKKGKASAQFGR